MINFDRFLEPLADELLAEYRILWPGNTLGNKDYERLSEEIKIKLTAILKKRTRDERRRLGVTVSPSTIEKILNKTYAISYTVDGNIHPESEKILHKLSIYLKKYKNWYDFVSIHQRIDLKITDEENKVLETIRESTSLRYKFLQNGNGLEWSALSKYYEMTSEAYMYAFLERAYLIENDIRIDVKQLNLFIEPVKFYSDDFAIVTLIEYCNLYKGRHKISKTLHHLVLAFTYFIIKEGGQWKITKKLLGELSYGSAIILSKSKPLVVTPQEMLHKSIYVNLI